MRLCICRWIAVAILFELYASTYIHTCIRYACTDDNNNFCCTLSVRRCNAFYIMRCQRVLLRCTPQHSMVRLWLVIFAFENCYLYIWVCAAAHCACVIILYISKWICTLLWCWAKPTSSAIFNDDRSGVIIIVIRVCVCLSMREYARVCDRV